ncbi:MAG: hypothetical protein BWX72_01513 [Firmicutes bacterium ADurb.Bin080]|mgnify:CR=1 FL=1|jgi:hypothetical protein|nr:hypothetical protein [Clostridiales bacterium]OQC13870.1 MAG: hypothetical protein BWX72_01513 [Firmicutes bacterium ADurb.Bin080]
MDKKAFSLLSVFVETSKDGEYVVFEKKDLIDSIVGYNEGGIEELDSAIKYLEMKKLIEIKISDSINIAVKPTPDAYIFVELEQKGIKKNNQTITSLFPAISTKKIFLFLLLTGFIGGIVAGIIILIAQIFLLK